MVFMNASNVKSGLMAIANELELGFRYDTAQILDALYQAVECITGLENALDSCLMSARKEIMHLEATVKAAQDDMEAIAHKLDDGFVCFYCGANTLEECGKCRMWYEGFKWRGLQEGENNNV